MNKGNQVERHPIEPEELMAYLDGELPLERAATAAAHLERCRECQAIAGDLQGVSRRLMVWQVESGEDSEIPQSLAVALEERGQKKTSEVERRTWREVLHKRWKLVWIGGLAVVGLAVAMTVSVRRLSPPSSPLEEEAKDKIEFYSEDSLGKPTAPSPPPAIRGRFSAGKGSLGKLIYEPEPGLTTPEKVASGGGGGGRANHLAIPQGPMIVRTAGLALVTKEFEKTRAELERILRLHGGYVGQLIVSAPATSGRTLTATLRIPAEQLDAALAELKKLGRVDNESQGGEEVTQKYVDLRARLANARNTEQQLIDILRNRTGKLSDVLEVEQELDRVRGEIEEMDAERKNLGRQVDFATLNMTLTEEYRAGLQPVPVATATRLRNAAVEGYATMVEGLVNVVLFLFSYGPSLLLWGAVLFFPIRGVWRRLRRRAA